ncbi:MAG: hypothetical protein ABI716_01735 [Candidatus Saccharibacteria bacterium]
MQTDNQNQPSTLPITTNAPQPILQKEVYYNPDGTLFKAGAKLNLARPVILSLDADQHLRVYEIDKSSQQRTQILDISAPEVSRVYSMQSVLLIKTPKRLYQFDTSYAQRVNALYAQVRGGMAALISPFFGMFGMGAMKSMYENNPADIWLDTLRKHQYPVKVSRIDQFSKRMYSHLLLALLIGFVLLIVISFVVILIIMTVTGEF